MKNFYRIIIACLICSLFLGYACLPVRVEASAAAVAVGVAGTAATSVAPYIALGICLIIASGYVVDTIPKLISDVKSWINSVPGFYDYLIEQTTQGIEELTVVYIPEFVQNAMKKYAQQKGTKEPSKKYIYLPPEFHSLDRLSQAQLLGDDVTSELQTGNWLAQCLNNIALNIHGAIYEVKYSMESLLEHIPTSLTTLRTQTTSLLGDVKVATQTMRINMESSFNSLQTVTSEFRAAVNNKLSSMTDTLSSRMLDIKTATSALRTQFVDQIDQVQDLMASTIRVTSNISTTLSNFVAGTYDDIKVALSAFRSQVELSLTDLRTAIGNSNVLLKDKIATGVLNIQTSLDSISQSVSNSVSFGNAGTGNSSININGGLGWFGSSSQVLAKYGVGLLAAGAILKEFTDIEYFSSLITISLSIGLVCVFFGILLDVSSKESAKNQFKAANKQGSTAATNKNGG